MKKLIYYGISSIMQLILIIAVYFDNTINKTENIPLIIVLTILLFLDMIIFIYAYYKES